MATYPHEITSLQLLIDGVDYTSAVRPGSLTVTWRQSGVASMTAMLENVPDLKLLSDVILIANGERVFGGYLNSQIKYARADEIDSNITASDWSYILKKRYVKEEYVDKTDVFIITDILAKLNVGISVVEVPEVETVIPIMRFNRTAAFEAIEKVAKYTGGWWHVDAMKGLHYNVGDFDTLPFSFSQNPDMVNSFPATIPQVVYAGSEIVNVVEVVGGNYLSDDIEIYVAGTGQDKRLILPFRFYPPDGATNVQMWRNDGTESTQVWTPLNVLTGNTDAIQGANDVLYYKSEKVVEAGANWPALANALKVFGKREVPLRVRVRDDDSIAFYGIECEKVIVDKNILDKTVARAMAAAELAKYAAGNPTITLNTRKAGVMPGKKVTISWPHASGTFVVQEVIGHFDVNTNAWYSVTLGLYSETLYNLLEELARTRNAVEWRDDEVLDELFQRIERLLFSTSAQYTQDAPPYYFCPDGDTAAGALYFGTGTFDP